MSDFWRKYNYRVEAWDSDYQPPIQFDEISLSQSDVDATVETDDWECFSPTVRSLPRAHHLYRWLSPHRCLVGGDGNTVSYGVFGTIAVGAVVVDRSVPQANCTQIKVRLLGFGSAQEAELTRIPCPLGSNAQLVYEPLKPSPKLRLVNLTISYFNSLNKINKI